MKCSFVVVLALCLAQSAFAEYFQYTSLGFGAPNINGASNVGNPSAGDIIFDTSTNSFAGYAGSGTWITLGGTPPLPAGIIQAYAGASVPAGYFVCDGTAVSRTTYSALFAAIGTTYGSGDGSTTFNLPNAQGVFLRGAGTQTIGSVAYSGTQGVTQGDQMQGHIHAPITSPLPTGGNLNGNTAWTATGSSSSQLNGWSTGGPITDGTNGTPRTGAENRPANISVKYIIKY